MAYLAYSGKTGLAEALVRREFGSTGALFIGRAVKNGFATAEILLDLHDDKNRQTYPNATKDSVVNIVFFGPIFVIGCTNGITNVTDELRKEALAHMFEDRRAPQGFMVPFNALFRDIFGADFVTKYPPNYSFNYQGRTIESNALIRPKNNEIETLVREHAIIELRVVSIRVDAICSAELRYGTVEYVGPELRDGVVRGNPKIIVNAPRDSPLYTFGISFAHDRLDVEVKEWK